MPIYEYRCNKCGKEFEKIQKISDSPCRKCPHCGGTLRKMVSSPSFQFKGSGFYVNDYGKKNESSAETKIKATEKSAAAKPVETIPASKDGKE
jgi:putative FmdB family regulatory protein